MVALINVILAFRCTGKSANGQIRAFAHASTLEINNIHNNINNIHNKIIEATCANINYSWTMMSSRQLTLFEMVNKRRQLGTSTEPSTSTPVHIYLYSQYTTCGASVNFLWGTWWRYSLTPSSDPFQPTNIIFPKRTSPELKDLLILVGILSLHGWST